jgi:hypothetical protein
MYKPEMRGPIASENYNCFHTIYFVINPLGLDEVLRAL